MKQPTQQEKDLQRIETIAFYIKDDMTALAGLQNKYAETYREFNKGDIVWYRKYGWYDLRCGQIMNHPSFSHNKGWGYHITPVTNEMKAHKSMKSEYVYVKSDSNKSVVISYKEGVDNPDKLLRGYWNKKVVSSPCNK